MISEEDLDHYLDLIKNCSDDAQIKRIIKLIWEDAQGQIDD